MASSGDTDREPWSRIGRPVVMLAVIRLDVPHATPPRGSQRAPRIDIGHAPAPFDVTIVLRSTVATVVDQSAEQCAHGYLRTAEIRMNRAEAPTDREPSRGWTAGRLPCSRSSIVQEKPSVLFPTMTFALFFVVVLGGRLALERPAGPVEALRARPPASCSTAGGTGVLRAPGGSDGRQPRRGREAIGSARTDRTARAWMLAVGVVADLGRARRSSSTTASSSTRCSGLLEPVGLAADVAADAGRPAGRRSRSSSSVRSATSSTCTARHQDPIPFLDFAVYLSFFPHLVAGPIVRVSEFGPQLASPAQSRRRRRDPRHPADLSWPVQEGRDRQLPGDRHRRSGVRRSGHRPANWELLRRGVGLRGADLRRLLGLHRHRHRRRAADGHQVPAELRPAVLRDLDRRTSGGAGT